MEESAQVRSFVRKTQKTAILTGCALGFALMLLWSRQVGLGFFSGMALSVINFQLMAVDAFELFDTTPKKARKFIIGRFVLRFAILFGFLALIATRTDFDILAAFAGLFFVQAVLFAGRVREAVKYKL
ncbi:MAG: ATP synthase subunit I [Candidatus Latescibacteria bacterium]|nr:ATP synthase subunit I [Candidatus Latescibacterota bacterium]